MTQPTVRLRHLATIRNSNVDKKSHEGEQTVRLCNYTDVYYNDRIDETSDFMTATATEEEIDRFTLRESQVLMTKDSETADDIGIPAYVPHDMSGIICGYHLTQITPGSELDGRFLAWTLMSRKLRAWFEVSARGVTRFSLGQDAINDTPIPAPSLLIQHRIAEFLDRETERIDALIDKKRRLIDLLEEKRAATITQAVTKGLDPTAPMKDSGIPWIGNIPNHWAVAPIRRVSSFRNSNVDKKTVDGEISVLLCNYTDVYYGSYLNSANGFMPASATADEIRRFGLKTGTVIITKDSESADDIGVPAYVESAIDAVCGYHLTILEPTALNLVGEYLYWVLESSAMRQAFEVYAQGVTRFGLTRDGIGTPSIPVPPLAEQETIAKYLRSVGKGIQRANDKIAAQLDVLAEYRKALITAAVTGEIDVDNFDAERQLEGTTT